ncbi:MAG: flavodoxin domain-containing protein [Peptostreptococcaceae bacterium]|nr:flavodoxin domain-containing protein [Peptostreptococcaceae bacterium]
MPKVAIIYASVHHKNTEKLVKRIAQKCPVDLYDITQIKSVDLSPYEMIGFASGIYMARPHKLIRKFLNEQEGLPDQTFVILTSGIGKGEFANAFSEELSEKGFDVLGEFECRGYDTFGPFRSMYEQRPDHPNEDDIQNAIVFVEEVIQKMKIE